MITEVHEETKTKISDLFFLNHLLSIKNVQTLRDEIQTRHPAFNPKTLKKIAIVGAAEEGVRLSSICKQMGIEVLAICDDNLKKIGQKIDGIPVCETSTLSSIKKDIPIIIASHRVLKSSLKLREMGFIHIAPFALLQVLDNHLFPPHMFYEDWLEDLFNNRKEYQKLAPLLADDMSRTVLNAILGYRMTLDPTVLIPIIEWDLYGPNSLLTYTDNETYIDGGTFDGDTIRLFIERVNGRFNRIIGFEPDTNTFQKLKSNFINEARVEPINKGLYSHTTTLYFDNAGTRGSILTEQNEGIEVPVTCIDDVIQNEPVTYIKMNIEGAEIPALHGAKNTIQRHKPKLAISVYHRATDMWKIPFLVKELSSDYQLYLRQHDGGVIESVLYAIKK